MLACVHATSHVMACGCDVDGRSHVILECLSATVVTLESYHQVLTPTSTTSHGPCEW